MRLLPLVAAWAIASVVYWWGVLTLVGVLFGREGTGYHLAGLGLALAAWVAVTVLAVWRPTSTRSRRAG